MAILGPFTKRQIESALKAVRTRSARETKVLSGLIEAQKPNALTSRGIGGKIFLGAHDADAAAGRFQFPPERRYVELHPNDKFVRASEIIATNKIFQRAGRSGPTSATGKLVYGQGARQAYTMNPQRMKLAAHKVFDPIRRTFVAANNPKDGEQVRARLTRMFRFSNPSPSRDIRVRLSQLSPRKKK